MTWPLWVSPRVAELERDCAVLRERDRLVSERCTQLVVDLATLQRKHDRLVEQRLFRQGDIAGPLADPPKPPASPLTTLFGALGRMDAPVPVNGSAREARILPGDDMTP
jgi:hypothetical protein